MLKKYIKQLVLGLGLMLGVATIAFFYGGQETAFTEGPPENGLVCTENPTNTFTLTTMDGHIGTPDDNTVYMWGFSEVGAPFQHPSPVLCVTEGEAVTVIVNNTFAEDVSIIFPGQEAVMADGQPVAPQFDGGGNLASMAQTAGANGGSVTYTFTASNPGTHVYQSGTNPAKQVRMGLFGVLVVRPTRGDDFANNRVDSQFNPSYEYLALFSEIDPYMHQAVEMGRPFNMANYHPRYFMINGRGFPDTIAPNYATWLPSQPFGALAIVEEYDVNTNNLPALERYANVGSEIVPMHPHSKHSRIIIRDGRPVEDDVSGGDLSWENFSLPVGPGQSWDGTFVWEDTEDYTEFGIPVTVPQIQNMAFGELYSGSPYLGQEGPIPVDNPTLNECGEYFLVSHNHALQQITSWGVPMTGPITYLRVDPPGGCPAGN